VQLLLILPAVLFYLGPWHATSLAVIYDVVMIGLWLAALGAFLVLAGRLVQERRLVAAAPAVRR
jgi:hypothetical protein